MIAIIVFASVDKLLINPVRRFPGIFVPGLIFLAFLVFLAFSISCQVNFHHEYTPTIICYSVLWCLLIYVNCLLVLIDICSIIFNQL